MRILLSLLVPALRWRDVDRAAHELVLIQAAARLHLLHGVELNLRVPFQVPPRVLSPANVDYRPPTGSEEFDDVLLCRPVGKVSHKSGLVAVDHDTSLVELRWLGPPPPLAVLLVPPAPSLPVLLRAATPLHAGMRVPVLVVLVGKGRGVRRVCKKGLPRHRARWLQTQGVKVLVASRVCDTPQGDEASHVRARTQVWVGVRKPREELPLTSCYVVPRSKGASQLPADGRAPNARQARIVIVWHDPSRPLARQQQVNLSL
mmetsp:Transcript_6369/g.18891  ORF Transcript_6369/g.18891 Transcript_6369/m.18891 type:complete len:260 (-) Transcript_6369:440-1219(-)